MLESVTFTSCQMGILVIGILSHGLLLGGLVLAWVRVSWRKLDRFLATGCLVGGIVTLGLAWFGYLSNRIAYLEQLPDAKSGLDAELAMLKTYLGADPIGLGLWLSFLPLVFGTLLMVLWLLEDPTKAAPKRRTASFVVTALCIGIGVALALLALMDYLSFDDFYALLWVST